MDQTIRTYRFLLKLGRIKERRRDERKRKLRSAGEREAHGMSWGCSSMVECLSSKYKALHLIPRPAFPPKKKKVQCILCARN
jgi:hypothetical protein